MSDEHRPSPPPANQVHEQQQKLAAALEINSPDDNDSDSEEKYTGLAHNCLMPLLAALGWRGEERYLMESLPHFDEVEDIDDLRSVIARLNFNTSAAKISLSQLWDDALPCLFVDKQGALSVILQRDGNSVSIFDSTTSQYMEIEATDARGTAYLVSEIDVEKYQKEIMRHGWIYVLMRRFRRLAVQLVGITSLINLMALAVPIYVMSVYDKVIGTRSEESLVYFLAGILIVIAADMGLRTIRARALAYLGARCDALLTAAAFQQILHLPISLSERAPIGAQITRLKQFEGLREIFTGTVASAALDLPFTFVFLGAIILFGGVVAWVPVSLMVIFAIMAAITMPLTKLRVAATGEVRSKRQSFLIEMVTKHRSIREAHAEETWLARFKIISAESSRCHFKSSQLNLTIQTITQILVMSAGVATLGVGTLRVIEGEMTTGALIAVMALVWRVLSPMQSIFLSMNRLEQVKQSFHQVNSLMRMKLEREPGKLPGMYRKFQGSLSFSRVGFRYSSKSEPALMGLTLEIPPGQIVAVTGNSGAGKSTMLKLLTGLYLPQAGSVHIDGLDLRQLDMGELRHAIGYLPQKTTFFHGTIKQNLRLAHPEASEEDIKRACEDAGLFDYADTLPEGLNTRLNDQFQKQMPDGLRQRLALARAYVKNAPIYLFDEPGNNLDREGDLRLMRQLTAMRGRATIVFITHRPSHMRLADRILYLQDGAVVHDGKPDQILPLILDAA